MPTRIAMKITEEALAMIGSFTGAPVDVFGDDTFLLFTIISTDPLEFNVKFMNEEQIFAEVQNDNDIHVLAI